MARLAVFLVIVLVVWRVLSSFIPLGFIGLWVSVILVSWGVERAGRVLVERRRAAASLRELGHVDSPYNRGKLGSLLVGRGRYREAIPHLENAIEGDPESCEWAYRLGCALIATGRAEDAAAHLERVVARDEEHAYGAGLLRLAEARTAMGRPAAALAALDRFDENHGEGPESGYLRGAALKKLGRGPEARAAFARVGELAAHASGFQRKDARKWALRALVSRFLG